MQKNAVACTRVSAATRQAAEWNLRHATMNLEQSENGKANAISLVSLGVLEIEKAWSS